MAESNDEKRAGYKHNKKEIKSHKKNKSNKNKNDKNKQEKKYN